MVYLKLIGSVERNYHSQPHYICTIHGMMVSKSRSVGMVKKLSPESLKNYADYFQKTKVFANIQILHVNK